MARENINRQLELEPKRMDFALLEIRKKGLFPVKVSDCEINFYRFGNKISFFPYSGWFSGKGIIQGRGIKNLLAQL